MVNGETLPVVSEFVYLGIKSQPTIAFQVHVLRLASRLQRAAYLFKNLGCNGGGFDPGTCFHIFKSF
jgi:hypothetical protein